MSENKKKRSANATDKQKKLLVEYVKKKPQLISGKQTQTYTMKDAKIDWENIANVLNSFPGAHKDWKGWHKTWNDLRSRTKSKEAKNRMEYRGTGGGPLKEETLTNVEEEVLSIIKKVSIEGHDVQESSVAFNFTVDEKEIEFDMNSCEIVRGQDSQEVLVLSAVDPANILEISAAASAHTAASATAHTASSAIRAIAPILTSASGLAPTSSAVFTGVPITIPATCFEENLNNKLDIKKEYYKNKLIHMKNMEDLKLRKIKALESIGKSLRILTKKDCCSTCL